MSEQTKENLVWFAGVIGQVIAAVLFLTVMAWCVKGTSAPNYRLESDYEPPRRDLSRCEYIEYMGGICR